MQIVWTVILTILVFGIIIFIHELGHFLVAKWSDIKIHEFALGMGPKLFSFKKGDTVYSLRALPIGGYVKMEGEDEVSSDDRAFNKKPIIKKIAVIMAGAIMNLILGFILLNIIMSMQSTISSTTISSFREDSMSNGYGLEVGDKITKINGTRIYVDNDIVYKLLSDKDGIVDIQVKRDDQIIELNNVNFAMQSSNDSSAVNIDFSVTPQEKTFFNVIKESTLKCVSIGRLVWISLIDLITGNANINDLAGPIGVANAIGEASSMGISSFLMMFAFITINIGIFNLLPIPALDGGRLVFLIIESIRKKPIKPEWEGYIHLAGFFLLIALMIFVTFNDIIKIFK